MTQREARAKELLRLMEEEEKELAKYGYRFPALFTAVGFLLMTYSDGEVNKYDCETCRDDPLRQRAWAKAPR